MLSLSCSVSIKVMKDALALLLLNFCSYLALSLLAVGTELMVIK